MFQETWKTRHGRLKVMCDLHRHTQRFPGEKGMNSSHCLFSAGKLGFNNSWVREKSPGRGQLVTLRSFSKRHMQK